MTTTLQSLATLLVGIACGACASRATPSPADTPTPPLQRASPASTTPRAEVQPPSSEPCPPLQANEVSDDDTPSIAGAQGRANAGAWLEARGISKAAFRAWIRSRDPKNLEDFDAAALFATDDSCQTLTVGDKREDALVCSLSVRTSIMRLSAVAFIVRNKRILPVLEVGYAMPAMDWPDARWLDLQLAFSPDGREAELRDRAKPGSVLVRPPSACREYVKKYLACEEAHRNTAPLEGVCPHVMAPSGTLSFGHMPPAPPSSPMGGDRVELRGCAVALPTLDELVKEGKANGPYAAEFRDDRAFAIKSCNARGRYVWKGDRFVRSQVRSSGAGTSSPPPAAL